MKLDRTHKRILAILEENARASAAEIGRIIGLSRPAVQERIAAMERAGIIQGYRTVISTQVEPVHAVIFVMIAERPCDKALQWLRTLEGVTSVVSLSGEIDALVSVTFPGMSDLSTFNDRILASPLISSAKSSVVLRNYSGS